MEVFSDVSKGERQRVQKMVVKKSRMNYVINIIFVFNQMVYDRDKYDRFVMIQFLSYKI